MKNKKFIIATILILLTFFFSYKILEVPTGLTVDEVALGYNATLISRTGRDENNRFMPVFVLSNGGADWKQPLPQYYLVLLFKLFKPSLFLLRFSSVLITLLSFYLMYLLSTKIFSSSKAFFTAFIFITVPILMIQSHMGLDNTIPIPLTILWLYFLYSYSKKINYKHLLLSGLFLGLSFYSYKGMRAVFPVWYGITILYLINFRKNIFKQLRPIIIFSLASLPFLFISPLLNHFYPGAIFGGANPKINSFYDFIYPYISTFDLGFLFIKGDATLFHSTQIHGFFLLSTLPLFILGIYQALNENKFSRFLLLAFFTAPFLYGTVSSVHRASRLMCLLPIYALICTYSLTLIKRKSVLLVIVLLILANYANFLNYYYNDYRKLSANIFGDLRSNESFKYLSQESIKLNLTPYVAQNISDPFFESLYFPNGINRIHQDNPSPSNSILLTQREDIPQMSNIHANIPFYQILTNKDEN